MKSEDNYLPIEVTDGRHSSNIRNMEGKRKLIKGNSASAEADPSGNETRRGHKTKFSTDEVSKRKKRALTRKQLDSVECDNNKESTSDAEESHTSSDSDSDGDKDELQFVGGANSDDGSSSDSDEATSKTQKEIEANFELFDPQEEDAVALLLLLRHSRAYLQFGLQPQQLRELSEVVAGQGNIGSVARATAGADGRSEAAVGLVTLISIKQYFKATGPIVEKILSLAQTHASWSAVAELRKLLSLKEGSSSSKTVRAGAGNGTYRAETNPCLFINCRYTNLPLEVVAEAVNALSEDVKWSLETPEMDEDERPWYRFSHVIGATLIYRDTKAEDAPKRQKQRFGLDFTPIFAEFEQDVLSEGASVAFAVPTHQTLRFSSLPSNDGKKNSRDTRKRISVMQTLQEYLMVYAIPYERFERNQRQVKQRLAVESAIRH